MPKKTVLDDDAFIYQLQKKQTEKEKLHDMSFKGKLEYLWEYYKFYFLGGAVVIALIAYFIHSIMNPAPSPQLYVAMINNPIEENILTQYNTEFAKLLDLNTKREEIKFNTSFNFGLEDSYTLSMKQALSTYIYAGEVDAIIAPESQFEECINNGYLAKLSDKLPTDLYCPLTDKFYIASTSDDSEKTAYGIYLDSTQMYKNNNLNKERYILGIVAGAPHEENTIEFVRYLFNE